MSSEYKRFYELYRLARNIFELDAQIGTNILRQTAAEHNYQLIIKYDFAVMTQQIRPEQAAQQIIEGTLDWIMRDNDTKNMLN